MYINLQFTVRSHLDLLSTSIFLDINNNFIHKKRPNECDLFKIDTIMIIMWTWSAWLLSSKFRSLPTKTWYLQQQQQQQKQTKQQLFNGQSCGLRGFYLNQKLCMLFNQVDYNNYFLLPFLRDRTKATPIFVIPTLIWGKKLKHREIRML